MISMLLVGRLVRLFDARALVITGLALTALSLYWMIGFTPQMDDHLIVLSGVVQGLGLGLVFVPLSTVAFATLAPRFRTDATALFSLVRNIGSAIGISIVTVLLTRNTQINHADLASAITPFNPTLRALSPAAAGGDPSALAQMDNLVNAQGLLIAYIDDFKLMMIVTLLAMPLALLLRKPRAAAAGAGAAAAHME
jgi:MFS transporter, DHA2 family, multidrug resistance protein